MTRIVDSISLASPVDEVYAFVTTPATWPKWHPSSLGVSDATDHSLEVGEQRHRGVPGGGTTRAGRLDRDGQGSSANLDYLR